jgi:hypothetical protein
VSPLNIKDSDAYSHVQTLACVLRGAFPLLVLGPVFKTGEGSGNRLLVGSIPMRSRQLAFRMPVPIPIGPGGHVWPAAGHAIARFRSRGLTL